jgi:hypothetical protein
MRIDLGKLAGILVKIITAIPAAVRAVDVLAGRAGNLKGQQKQDAAVAVVLDAVTATEAIVGRDLVRDDEVDKALRAAIDAIVALQNVVIKKAVAGVD